MPQVKVDIAVDARDGSFVAVLPESPVFAAVGLGERAEPYAAVCKLVAHVVVESFFVAVDNHWIAVGGKLIDHVMDFAGDDVGGGVGVGVRLHVGSDSGRPAMALSRLCACFTPSTSNRKKW